MVSGGFDSSQFFAKARQRQEAAIAAAVKAVDEFGEHRVLGDGQQLAPVGGGSHSPKDPARGTLQASGTAEPAKLEGKMISKKIGFNTAYAAVQHEDLEFGHDVGQSKYLATALSQNKDKFLPFVAERAKAATEG